MQVILLERIGRLGQMGDVVKVKDGYARNFLLPLGKALRATKDNMTEFEKRRVTLEARNLELKGEAEKVSTTLAGKTFVAIRQAGDTGQLYGSVSPRDMAEVISAGGFTIDRRQVVIEKPIKNLGLHEVKVQLHPEVLVKVTMNVARSEDEAERQARSVTVVKDEAPELETYNPDAMFDEGARRDSWHRRAAARLEAIVWWRLLRGETHNLKLNFATNSAGRPALFYIRSRLSGPSAEPFEAMDHIPSGNSFRDSTIGNIRGTGSGRYGGSQRQRGTEDGSMLLRCVTYCGVWSGTAASP